MENLKWHCAIEICTKTPIAKSLDEPSLAHYIVTEQEKGKYPMVGFCRIKDTTFPDLLVIEKEA